MERTGKKRKSVGETPVRTRLRSPRIGRYVIALPNAGCVLFA
ncbi:MAG: hypothetical protein P1P61_08890 [Treponemataceae bacterium]